MAPSSGYSRELVCFLFTGPFEMRECDLVLVQSFDHAADHLRPMNVFGEKSSKTIPCPNHPSAENPPQGNNIPAIWHCRAQEKHIKRWTIPPRCRFSKCACLFALWRYIENLFLEFCSKNAKHRVYNCPTPQFYGGFPTKTAFSGD